MFRWGKYTRALFLCTKEYSKGSAKKLSALAKLFLALTNAEYILACVRLWDPFVHNCP